MTAVSIRGTETGSILILPAEGDLSPSGRWAWFKTYTSFYLGSKHANIKIMIHEEDVFRGFEQQLNNFTLKTIRFKCMITF